MKKTLFVLPLIALSLLASCNKKTEYLELYSSYTTYEDGVKTSECTREIEKKHIKKNVLTTFVEGGYEITTTTYDEKGNTTSEVTTDEEGNELEKKDYERKYENNLLTWEKITYIKYNEDHTIYYKSTEETEYKYKNRLLIWEKSTAINGLDNLNSLNAKASSQTNITKIEYDNLKRVTKKTDELYNNDELASEINSTYKYKESFKDFVSETTIKRTYKSTTKVTVTTTKNTLNQKGKITDTLRCRYSGSNIDTITYHFDYDKHNNCCKETGVELNGSRYSEYETTTKYYKNNPKKIENQINILIYDPTTGKINIRSELANEYDKYDRLTHSTITSSYIGQEKIETNEIKFNYDQVIPA